MPPLLRVDQLTHRYDKSFSSHPLRSVTFSVEVGQVCAVAGASGSGKTTLLRLISGLLEPDKGAIWLSEQRVTGPSQNLVPGHPDIRTVFQDFALVPNLSVYHNIAYPLRAYRSDYRQDRTRELIERFQLQEHENQLPASLSGGEKQRVALARALAEEPVLLLLDEPFSQVDPPLKNQLMNQVVDILKETAGTALFVTHDSHDALAWSDQVVVLRQGEVVQQGTPQQIYEQPTNPYVAQLMGECSLVPIKEFCQWFPHYPARDTVGVGIRAEHVSLLPDTEQGIRGKVVRCSYQGAHYRLLVKLSENVIVSLRNRRTIAVGTSVGVAIETACCLRFNINSS